MTIVGLPERCGADEGAESDCDTVAPFGPGGIYHEKQVGALCGLHSVNNLLQGPRFDVGSFQAVAQELDWAEQQITGGQGLDYGNARADGFYNVQVIQVILGQAGYDMFLLHSRGGSIHASAASESAFILNKHKHWFALRRIGREWFDLNSCLGVPRHYRCIDLGSHIVEAVDLGYDVFVVRGDFPRCTLDKHPAKLREAVKGCRPLEQSQDRHPVMVLFAAHWFGAAQFDPDSYPVGLVQDCFKCTRRRSLARQIRRALKGSEPDGPEASTRGPVWQHWPVFVLFQSLAAFLLWISYAWADGEGPTLQREGGLESMFPGRTALVFHRDCVDYRPQIWRWYSFQFTHSSLSHVAMNIFLVVLTGVALEGAQGTAWIACVFNAGLVGGACCHLAFNSHAAQLVGMSAGTYSLMGVHLMDLILNWPWRRFRRWKLLFLVLMALLDVLHLQFALSAHKHGGARAVATHAPQLGGYLVGLLLGVSMGRHAVSIRCEQTLRAMALLTGAILATFSIAWACQWPPRTVLYPTPWCWARQVHNRSVFKDSAWHCVRCQDQACIDKWSKQFAISRVDFNACDDDYGWAVTER